MSGEDRLILHDSRGAELVARLDAADRLELAIEDPDGEAGTIVLTPADLHALADWMARRAEALADIDEGAPR